MNRDARSYAQAQLWHALRNALPHKGLRALVRSAQFDANALDPGKVYESMVEHFGPRAGAGTSP